MHLLHSPLPRISLDVEIAMLTSEHRGLGDIIKLSRSRVEENQTRVSNVMMAWCGRYGSRDVHFCWGVIIAHHEDVSLNDYN